MKQQVATIFKFLESIGPLMVPSFRWTKFLSDGLRILNKYIKASETE